MNQITYRFETLVWAITSILWTALLIVSINLVFGQTSSIAGWRKDEVLVLASTHVMFVAVMWFVFLPSFSKFSEQIKKGTFDFYLLRPIKTRFLLSVNTFKFDSFTSVVLGAALISVYLTNLKIVPSAFDLSGFGVAFIFGVIIFYNLFFMATTTAIWLIDISEINDLFSNIMDSAKYPVYIFNGAIKFLFIYLVPTAFIATFPVQFLLGRGNIWTLLLASILVIITSIASHKFWNFALKHYSSASS